jgi:hypothetical protein
MNFAPPFTAPSKLLEQMRSRGYAVLDPAAVAAIAGVSLHELDGLRAAWNALPPDNYLKDGGRYRRRRHSCFVADGGVVSLVEHRAHWQPLEYNALHGGMERWFEPIDGQTLSVPAWGKLLGALAQISSQLKGRRPWYVEAHQFRIDTTDGIGRPTPEGAHRDGVDVVAVFLVGREGIKGGETRVFESDGPGGQRFTLAQPWSLLLLDDARVVHESTPIQPVAEGGHRDTLVVTLRADAFQGP